MRLKIQRWTVLILSLCLSAPAPAGQRLKLMTFNMWGAGANQGLPIDQTLAVLRAVDADIIGLQETRAEVEGCSAEWCPAAGADRGADLAEALGYFHHTQTQDNAATWANTILSRFPILQAMPHDLGVVIDVEGRRVHAFNIHATDYPHQPYQLLGIPYGDAPFLHTPEEAVESARAARAEALALLTADIAAEPGAELEVVFGDFNEPSHRDWTARAAAAGTHPMAVAFPFTRALETQGFIDALRAVHPDEVAKPAFTWTPTTDPNDPLDHHDRIDYVFVRGAGVHTESAAIVGEKSPEADIVVAPWPSDHRAVVVTISLD